MSFIPGAIPDIVSYDPLKPFGRWLMEFEDNCDPDAIEDVFAFIEDELRYTITSTLPEDHSILSDDDLFESPVDINTLTQETNNPFETEDFADFDTQTELETTAVEVANNSKIVNKSSTQDSKNNKLTVNSEGPVTELNSMELLKTEVFEIEDEEDLFRLYTDQKDWPTALESCMKTFINMEEYEKCIIIQELQKEYEINKLVTESQKTPSTTRRKTTKK